MHVAFPVAHWGALGTPWITGYTLGNNGTWTSGDTVYAGCYFKALKAVKVTALGGYFSSSPSVATTIRLSTAASVGSTVASVTIPAGAKVPSGGGFVYVAITPVTLQVNLTYFLCGDYGWTSSGETTTANDAQGVTTTTAGSNYGTVWWNTGGTYTENPESGQCFGPTNFLYH